MVLGCFFFIVWGFIWEVVVICCDFFIFFLQYCWGWYGVFGFVVMFVLLFVVVLLSHFYSTLLERTDLKKTRLRMTMNMTVSLNILQEHR